MNRLKTLVIDDEWLIRAELKRLLSEYDEIEIVGEAAHLSEAIELMQKFKPDVIFLDIQLSGESGFDLLEKTQVSCEVVFVTAYDQYAIRAFDVNAMDYLLKPIKKERLARTIQRLLKNETQISKPSEKVKYDDVVYLMINGSLKFVRIKSLKCIIAQGNYSDIIYIDGKKDLVSKSLQEWEEILPEKYFARIHRSTIVNFEQVEKVEKCENQTCLVYIKNFHEPFTMSRRYAAKLKKMLSW